MNVDRVEAIMRLLQGQEHVGEIEVQAGGWRLRARKLPGIMMPPTEPAPSFDTDALPEPHRIRSRWVGIFRSRGTLPEVGTRLPQGTVLGHVDSMRVLNPVTVDEEGYLVGARVEDGEAVEYGQELFTLSLENPPDADDPGESGHREEGQA